jgi:hypothetical protein
MWCAPQLSRGRACRRVGYAERAIEVAGASFVDHLLRSTGAVSSVTEEWSIRHTFAGFRIASESPSRH